MYGSSEEQTYKTSEIKDKQHKKRIYRFSSTEMYLHQFKKYPLFGYNNNILI